MVNEMAMHMNFQHGFQQGGEKEKKATVFGSVHRESEAFILATQKKKIPAGADDANTILHEVRFYANPVNPGFAARVSPLIAVNYVRPDFSYLGLYVSNDMVIEAVLDRANKKLKPEWFSPQNLSKEMEEIPKVQKMDDGSFRAESKYKNIGTPGEAVQCLRNWALIHMHFHPRDFGPLASFNVAFKKFCYGFNKRIKPFTKFFNQVVLENANRALRGQSPMDYDECLLKWSQCVTHQEGEDDEEEDNGEKVKEEKINELKRKIDRMESIISAFDAPNYPRKSHNQGNKKPRMIESEGPLFCKRF